jgi:hypothetical protein
MRCADLAGTAIMGGRKIRDRSHRPGFMDPARGSAGLRTLPASSGRVRLVRRRAALGVTTATLLSTSLRICTGTKPIHLSNCSSSLTAPSMSCLMPLMN